MKRIAGKSYLDFNSPGTVFEDRGEREPDPPAAPISTEGLPKRLETVIKGADTGPTAPRLLPPSRFSDTEPTDIEKRIARVTGDPKTIGPHSKTVRIRLAKSCGGWSRPPTPIEFQNALLAEVPDRRQRAILTMWASEAEWFELLQARLEDAYTFRTLATALHRIGLTRSPASTALNSWATPQ